MPENNTPTSAKAPDKSPDRSAELVSACSPSSVSLDLGRRVSMGEIAAFVVETKRMLNGGSASAADRLVFFEWKADVFSRLGERESARTAAAEAARLRDQLTDDGRGAA